MRKRRIAVGLLSACAAACADRPGVSAPEEPELVRFRILFVQAETASPRRPGLMMVSAFRASVPRRADGRAGEANTCVSLTANPCVFLVPRDGSVTLMAHEGPGLLADSPLPLDLTDRRPGVDDAIEFLDFTAPDFTPLRCDDFVGASGERGVCHVFAQDDTTVVARYRPMRRIVVAMAGAGTLTLRVTAPPPLALDPPAVTSPLNGAYRVSRMVAPDPAPVFGLWLPRNGAVEVDAVDGEATRFLGWEGCAGGATCRVPTGTPAAVTARFEYWDCSAAGLGLAPRPLDPRCVLRP